MASDNGKNESGSYGGGYLLRKYFPRTAVISAGFALVTAAAPPSIDATLVVPSVSQQNQEGYRYPARTVRHTEPQQGWLYTGSQVPPFDSTIVVGPAQQLSQSYRLSFKRSWPDQNQPAYQAAIGSLPEQYVPTVVPPQQSPVPRKPWFTTAYHDAFWNGTGVIAAPDTYSTAKFPRAIGFDRTPSRVALKFRYPLASAGFSTDGSSTSFDTWTPEKFQSDSSSTVRMPDRKKRPLALDHHKFPFGLLDARPIRPAFEQLQNSYRQPTKRPYPRTDNIGSVFFTTIPPFNTVLSTAAAHELSQSYRSRDRRTWPAHTVPSDSGWMGSLTAATVPVVVPPQQRPVHGKVWFTSEYPTQPPFQQLPDVWNASKFQNIPLQEPVQGKPWFTTQYAQPPSYSVVISFPDVWDESKFQNNHSSRMPDRKGRPLAWDYHDFPFQLVSEGEFRPAIDQLTASFRTAPKTVWFTSEIVRIDWVTNIVPPYDASLFPRSDMQRMPDRNKRPLTWKDDGSGWIVGQVVPFDARLVPHSSDDRMRDRYKKVPRNDQPNEGWRFANLPPWDARLVVHQNNERMRDRYKKVPRNEQPNQGYSSGPIVGANFVLHSVDERMRDQYKKVPRVDQLNDGWLVLGAPAFNVAHFIRGQEPYRMPEGTVLDLQLQDWVWTMAQYHGVLNLVDTNTPPPASEDLDPHFTRPASTTPYWLAYPRRRRQWRKY